MQALLKSFRLSVLATLLICIAASYSVAVEFETIDPIWGRSIVSVPESTEEGRWEGTWLFNCRDFRMALWFRDGAEHPEMKLQFSRWGVTEEFATDWDGHASYVSRGAPGEFKLLVTEGDENTILATWYWDLQFIDSGKTETARVIITRAGDGRGLIMNFEDMQSTIRRVQSIQTASPSQTLTFLKVSKRLVRWEELP